MDALKYLPPFLIFFFTYTYSGLYSYYCFSDCVIITCCHLLGNFFPAIQATERGVLFLEAIVSLFLYVFFGATLVCFDKIMICYFLKLSSVGVIVWIKKVIAYRCTLFPKGTYVFVLMFST